MTDKGFAAFLGNASKEGKGFWLVHDKEHSIVRLPPAHLIFTMGHHLSSKEAKGANGLRWGCLDIKDKGAVEAADRGMDAIMEAYPDLRGGEEYILWSACLKSHLLPSVSGAPA